MATNDRRIDMERLKSEHGLDDTVYRLTGEEVPQKQRKIHCPFHADHTPSLHVYEDGGWKCFSCGKSGDLLDFIGYYRFGNSYNPATHFLEIVDYLGALEIKAPVTPKRELKAKEKPTLTISMSDIERWHATMPDERRAYWHERGLTQETIDYFRLGWNGRRYTIPATYRNIPFGVKLRQSDIPDGVDAKYIQVSGSRVGLFNTDALVGANRIVICEGEIDAMLLQQLGYPAITSTGGCATFRNEWAKFFTHVKEIYILFDNDEPGRLGASNVKRILRRAEVLTLPEGIKDVGELMTTYQAPITWLYNNLW